MVVVEAAEATKVVKPNAVSTQTVQPEKHNLKPVGIAGHKRELVQAVVHGGRIVPALVKVLVLQVLLNHVEIAGLKPAVAIVN